MEDQWMVMISMEYHWEDHWDGDDTVDGPVGRWAKSPVALPGAGKSMGKSLGNHMGNIGMDIDGQSSIGRSLG